MYSDPKLILCSIFLSLSVLFNLAPSAEGILTKPADFKNSSAAGGSSLGKIAKAVVCGAGLAFASSSGLQAVDCARPVAAVQSLPTNNSLVAHPSSWAAPSPAQIITTNNNNNTTLSDPSEMKDLGKTTPMHAVDHEGGGGGAHGAGGGEHGGGETPHVIGGGSRGARTAANGSASASGPSLAQLLIPAAAGLALGAQWDNTDGLPEDDHEEIMEKKMKKPKKCRKSRLRSVKAQNPVTMTSSPPAEQMRDATDAAMESVAKAIEAKYHEREEQMAKQYQDEREEWEQRITATRRKFETERQKFEQAMRLKREQQTDQLAQMGQQMDEQRQGEQRQQQRGREEQQKR